MTTSTQQTLYRYGRTFLTKRFLHSAVMHFIGDQKEREHDVAVGLDMNRELRSEETTRAGERYGGVDPRTGRLLLTDPLGGWLVTYGALDKPIDIREAREWRGKVGGPQAAKIRNRHVKKDGHGKKTKLKSKQKLKLPEGHPDESVEDEDEDADDYGFTFDSSINKDMRSTFSFVHQLHKEGVEAAQKLKPGRAGQTIDGNGLSKYPNTQLRLGEDIQQVRDLTKSGGWDLNRIINEVEYQLKAVQFFRTQTPKEIQDGLRELAERYPKRAGHLIFQSPGENSGHNVFTEKQLRKQRENVKRLNPNAVVTGQPMLKEEQEAAWRMQSVQHPYRSFVLEHNEHQRIVDKRGVREGFG